MKVSKLISILQEMDPDASVYIMDHEQWPFEQRLHGVAVRRDFTDSDPGDEALEERTDRWSARSSQLPGNDVFLVSGEQLRHGDREAWRVARR